MSSTGRKADRVSFDDYPTPIPAIDSFLAVADLPKEGRWLEPCAGEGRVIERVQAVHSDAIKWHAWEIQQKYQSPLEALGANVWIGDSLDRPSVILDRDLSFPYPFDVAITNPAYEIAMPLLLVLRQLAPIVILLLRRNFIGSIKRHAYLSQNMPDEYVLPKRPSFVWVHKYKLRCSCGKEITRRVQVPASVPPLEKGSGWPGTHECGGSFVVVEVKTTKNDSCEYCWAAWTPESGPIGTTQMLPLSIGGESG